VLGAGVACVAVSLVLSAQTETVPRPPAMPPPAGESTAPDGYQPLPQWLGQTRASAPARTAAFTVQTFVAGTNGAAFEFLPDGRILLGERNGGPDGSLYVLTDGANGRIVRLVAKR
jgi:glucose/arabinose dehydrogenase